MIFLLLLLPKAFLFVEGGERKYFFHAFIAGILDILLAHTSWVRIAGWPQKGEWTISQTLRRLANDDTHENQMFFLGMSLFINKQSPTGRHIEIWTTRALTPLKPDSIE